MPGLVDLLVLAGQKGPPLVELIQQLHAAGKGDPVARLALPGQLLETADQLRPGLKPALENLARAGAGVVQVIRGGEPPVVEGEFQEVPPWEDFGRHLYALDWGVIAILGAKGEGKTTVGTKILWKFAQKKGYIPEFVGVYPEDLPPWGHRISMERLVARVRKVARYIDQEEGTIDDGVAVTRKAEPIEPSEIE